MGDSGEQEERVDGPLLDPAACDDEVTPNSQVIVVPRRKIIIEPLLMLFALIAIPMSILTQQFIVAKITESHHLNSTGNHSHQESYCSINESSSEYVEQQLIQAEAARFNVYSSLCFSIPALFVTIFLGSLSDKLGRKAAILPPLFGGLFLTLTYLIIILLDLPIWYLLIGRLVEGLCGSYLALLMGCFAYIADITRPEDRQFRIAVVELIMFLAGIVGPAGIGVWIEEIGYLYPFLAVLAGFILCIAYAVFLIPETVVRQQRVKLCDPGHLQKCVMLFVKDDGSGRQWKLAMLILSFFIVGTVQLTNGGVDTLFEMNSPLCWNSAMLGYYAAAYIGVSSLLGLLLAKTLCLCCKDTTIALLAGLNCILKSIYTGLVINTIMMFCGVLFGPLSVLYFPTMRAIMSKLVAPLEQGSLFGAIAFVEVVCSLVGSVSTSSIYAATLHISTGFVYFYAALVHIVGNTVLLLYILRVRRQKSTQMLVVNDDTEKLD